MNSYPIYQEVTHRLHDTAYVPKETAVGAGLMVLRQKHSEAHSDLFNDTETKHKLQLHAWFKQNTISRINEG